MKNKRQTIWKYVRQYLAITAVSVLNAIAFNWFYLPNDLTCGGITGIVQIINHYLPMVPIGITTFAFNVPLFLLSWKQLGKGYLCAAVYGLAMNSIIIDVLSTVYPFAPMSPILASVYGGVTLGATLGMLLYLDAAAGGTELAARLLARVIPHLPVGRIVLAIDLSVIAAYAAVFRSLENALYGGIALFFATKMIDIVVYGGRQAKLMHIISRENEKIAAALMEKDIGATLLSARGCYSGDSLQILFCAIRPKEIAAVKQIVNELDSSAFLTVSDAREVFGEGFVTYRPDDL